MDRHALANVVAVFILAYFIPQGSGSSIEFKGSSSSIKPLVTQNFTLRCALNDSSASPGSPSAVVGKRSVTSLDRIVSEHDVIQAHRTKKDSARSVTSSADSVMLVTSIIISRDGTDLATMIEHLSAAPVGGASGFTVTGQLTPGDREKGFLQLVWPHPTPQDAGNFRCDVDTLSQTGHHVDFSQTLAVAEEEVTMADLVVQLSSLQAVIDRLTLANGGMNRTIDYMVHTNSGMNHTIDHLIQTNSGMNHTIDHLTQKISDMSRTIDDMNRTNAAMNSEILQLKSQQVPHVFFSAAFTSGSYPLSNNQVVIYNDVLMNEGGGYSPSTGTFTCPVSGYYYFEISALSRSNRIELELQKNGNVVVEAFTSGNNPNSATNSAIVKLAKGDTVRVVSDSTSYLDGIGSAYRWNTFIGKMIATL